MREIKLSLTKVKDIFLEIKRDPSALFKILREEMVTGVSGYLESLMEAEITLFIGRKPYERGAVKNTVHYRNGKYERSFAIKGIGEVRLSVPRDRDGKFKTQVLPRYQRRDVEITRDLVSMYLGGLSTRTVDMISRKLLGTHVSSGTVSNSNKMLCGAVENWRGRDLSECLIRYMYVDGVNFEVRLGKSVETYPVLVAIGMNDCGVKTVLGFQGGDKESASSWREFFKDLKGRGFRSGEVKLGVMDGLPGLEKVFGEEFPGASVQRCQVHLARNVLAKVPRDLKKDVADSLRDIFYASSHHLAMDNFDEFKEKWQSLVPSAVKCLEKSVEQAVSYLKFDEVLWPSLRTTNPIERLNKEFKRRTKPMEIAGGEASLYNILTFISLKMEIGWKRASLGRKLRKSSPKELPMPLENFTQNT